MISSPRFIFIESNTSGTGELLIHKAFEKKLVPVFITQDPKKYTFLPCENLNVVMLDTSNKNLLLEYLSEMGNIKGIYSTSEYFVETAAGLAENLKLRGTSSQVIRNCRNKALLYKKLLTANFWTPETVCLSTEEEADANIKFPFPVVIKPNNGSGSIGVKLCQNQEEATHHIKSIFNNTDMGVVVQEYVNGEEFSVEVCSFDDQHYIIGITKKYLSEPPYFIEIGHDFPAVLSKINEENIKKTIKEVLTFLGFHFGFCHIELKIDHGKICIIEVNPRLAGGMIPALIEKAKGLDMLGLLLDLYSGESVNIEMPYHQFASIRHLVGVRAGRIKLFINHNPLADEIKFVKNPGDFFIPQGDFRDRIAYLITSAADANLCQVRANEAIQKLDVILED